MADNKNSRMPRNIGAFLAMLTGGILMVMLVVSFNKTVYKKESGEKRKTRIVQTKKLEKKVTKKKTTESKARKKQKTASNKVSPPNLGAMIGGIEMNIPELAAGDIGGDANELLEEIAQDTVMSEDTVDKKPAVSYRAPIEYPQTAAEKGIRGYVVLNLLIAKDGSVKLAKVLEAEPQGVFENTVLKSIREWRFAPAKYKDAPVQVWVKQKISFNT